MSSHNAALATTTPTPEAPTASYYAQIVTDYQATERVELRAGSLPRARREALELLADVRVGQGWVELYERLGRGTPLLVWVGVV